MSIYIKFDILNLIRNKFYHLYFNNLFKNNLFFIKKNHDNVFHIYHGALDQNLKINLGAPRSGG